MNESNGEGYKQENEEEYELVLNEKLLPKECARCLMEALLIICLIGVCASLFGKVARLGSNNSNSNEYGYRQGVSTSDIQIPKTTKQCFVQYEVKGKENFKDIWKNNVVGYDYENTLKLISENNKYKATASLYKGQLIYLPTMTNPNCNIYTVKKGDTVYSIAEEFFKHINIEDSIKIIKESNGNVDIVMLEEGQNLLIPEN